MFLRLVLRAGLDSSEQGCYSDASSISEIHPCMYQPERSRSASSATFLFRVLATTYPMHAPNSTPLHKYAPSWHCPLHPYWKRLSEVILEAESRTLGIKGDWNLGLLPLASLSQPLLSAKPPSCEALRETLQN